MTIGEFKLLFAISLRADKRGVKMTEQIPWNEIEKDYTGLFKYNIGNLPSVNGKLKWMNWPTKTDDISHDLDNILLK